MESIRYFALRISVATAGVFGWLFVACAISLLISSIVVIGSQIYDFLKWGAWPPLPLTGALEMAGSGWAKSPESWKGIWRILHGTPLSAGALLLSILVGIAGAIFLSYIKQLHKPLNRVSELRSAQSASKRRRSLGYDS